MPYWTMTFDGRKECVADARHFAVKVLGDAPGVDLVELVTSELAGNAVQHTGSGQPGGQFILHVAEFRDRWQVRVDDAGGSDEPGVRETEADWDEAGRGLALVASVSSQWGVIGDRNARGVWAEILMPGDGAS
jgi:serine/threonine-protein kinase RsbW